MWNLKPYCRPGPLANSDALDMGAAWAPEIWSSQVNLKGGQVKSRCLGTKGNGQQSFVISQGAFFFSFNLLGDGESKKTCPKALKPCLREPDGSKLGPGRFQYVLQRYRLSLISSVVAHEGEGSVHTC